METVRIRGTARPLGEGKRPLRRVALVAGKDRVALVSEKETVATLDEGEFELDLAGGGAVAVEAPAEGLAIVGRTASIVQGPWGELRDRPEAAGLVRNVVPPYTEVELHVTSVEEHDPIEVYGTVEKEEKKE